MANSLTNLGEEYGLIGDGSGDGSVARKGATLRLYDNTSTPAKDGTGFVEVATGNGYAAKAISVSDWAFSVLGGNGRIQLADQTWTASGGNIANIAGAYLADSGGNVLAWWERPSAVTIAPGDTITADDLTIELT